MAMNYFELCQNKDREITRLREENAELRLKQQQIERLERVQDWLVNQIGIAFMGKYTKEYILEQANTATAEAEKETP